MKVRELIERLQKCDLEKEVTSEGCDCTGEVADVEESPFGHDVHLTRSVSQDSARHGKAPF